MKRKYLLKQDPHDIRDKMHSVAPKKLPDSVDLRPLMSPIVDQGALGSCTANAIASGLGEYLQITTHQPLVNLSRLYLYWHERRIEGTINEDAGAYLRDGMKVFQTLGIAPESDFPYDITKFTLTPSAQAEKNAASNKIGEYHRILLYDDLKAALADGNPVVFGTLVYSSFEDWGTSLSGILLDVDRSKESLLGGHALLAVGFKKMMDNNGENEQEYIIFRNSWGTVWGDKGYGYMPKSYWDRLCVMDMWVGTNPAAPPPPSLTFDQSVEIMAKSGIVNSPDFWHNLGKKYANDTTSDFRYLRQLVVNMGNYLSKN